MTAVADFVWIHNPTTGGVALQHPDAVRDLWVKKGFNRVDVDLDAASRDLGYPVTVARQLPEDYVREHASRRLPTPPLAERRPAAPRETPAVAVKPEPAAKSRPTASKEH